MPIWKINFCSSVLRLSELPRCKERPQITICCLKWLGRLKCLATGLDASLLFLSTSRRCSRNRSPSRLPVSPMYSLLQQVQVMQSMTLAEVHINWSVMLMDLLGPDIFSTLWMKGQVLHRERAHLKVPDWSLVWNELLTKKLPMFLSRLNEISGGCEKIVPVSESFWSSLKNDRFNRVVVRVKCESEWNAVSVFLLSRL